MGSFPCSDCASLRKIKTDYVNESLSYIRSDTEGEKYIYMYVCVYIHVCMYVCVYIHVGVYTHIHTHSHYKPTNLRFLKVLATDIVNVTSLLKNYPILIPNTQTHTYIHTLTHTTLSQHLLMHSHRALFILTSYQGLRFCLPNIFQMADSQKVHSS